MRRPIEPYCRVPIVVREADPRASEVADRVIALIAARRPGARAEHVGSSAVPGLAGKGTIDLLLPASPEEIPAVTRDLLALGFQRQAIPTAFPPTRPMLQGAINDQGAHFRIHVHVIPTNLDDAVELREFRDALRRDPAMCEAYTARKRAIVSSGMTDALQYTQAKSGWIEGQLDRLGIRPARETP
jgi:GrpB-like predicted nucleotidyltransferase (UPF0157 family)